MAKQTILIIEDDPDIVELLQYNLEREGYRVISASNGELGLHEARRRKPGAILLDLMLPGMDGLEICRQLKQEDGTRDIPLLMVTAKGEESDVVTGLELGADDYLSKPFSPRELIARLKAVLRRGAAAGPKGRSRIEVGEVVLDRERYEVKNGNENVTVTRAEFRLLWTLASHPGRVYTRDELVERITDGEAVILDRNVDVHISALRKKLGPDTDVIATVRGVGYKCLDGE